MSFYPPTLTQHSRAIYRRSLMWIRKLASQAIFHLNRHLVIREPRIKYYFIASKNRKRWRSGRRNFFPICLIHSSSSTRERFRVIGKLFPRVVNVISSGGVFHHGDGVWVGGQRSTFWILVRKSPPPLLSFAHMEFPPRLFGSPF